MKKVKVESQGLKNQGNDAVNVRGSRDYPLGSEVVVSDAEARKLQEADLENAFDVKVTVTVEDAGEDTAPAEQHDEGEPGGSEPPTPSPEGTARSRGR